MYSKRGVEARHSWRRRQQGISPHMEARAPNDSPIYPAALTHRQVSYGEGDGGNGGGLFTRNAAATTSVSAYGANGDYYQQLQAHAANTRQLLADGAFNAAYSQGGGGGGSNIHSYAGGGGTGSGGQLDLSVSTGSRSFQQQQQQQHQHQPSNSPYGLDSGVARFGSGGGYEEGDPAPPHTYYNTNPRSGAALPPPLGMYEQNYRNCYQNNASMTAAAVAAAAYNYHYQQQQLQQQQQQQEADSSYDRAPYDYGRNRYLF
ncbi:hypothetical protein EGR_05530 [Echinococcus granulosus]|uniref:Uncharacterized protein n=1 Tax=Echinococcus granulosus TaxID=6210 RepID=W6UFH6_ECHGR|nr:hypothetical protein EGR_05530 [Echinococcus granulosus]EUB59631.1 hypothetical protein EGR_05530 [Echinococcus granulosus]